MSSASGRPRRWSRGGEAEDAEDDEAQVADGGIGDQLLQIGLHQRDQRAIDDADDGQHDDPAGALCALVGEHADVEAHQAVGAHLQQHAGEQHGAGGGRFHVGIRQPCVQREKRHFYGERDKEAEEEPLRCGGLPLPPWIRIGEAWRSRKCWSAPRAR